MIPPPVPLRLAVSAVLLAAGSSALYPTLVALVVDRVPARERGVAIGTVSGAWDLGVFAGSPGFLRFDPASGLSEVYYVPKPGVTIRGGDIFVSG